MSLPFLIYMGMVLVSFFQGSNLSVVEKNIKTKYVFQFVGSREVHIDDEYNRISRSWGSKPDSIVVESGIRKIIFTTAAILKTENDSIEPNALNVKLKGYMGVTTKENMFTVSKSGVISSNKWHGG